MLKHFDIDSIKFKNILRKYQKILKFLKFIKEILYKVQPLSIKIFFNCRISISGIDINCKSISRNYSGGAFQSSSAPHPTHKGVRGFGAAVRIETRNVSRDKRSESRARVRVKQNTKVHKVKMKYQARDTCLYRLRSENNSRVNRDAKWSGGELLHTPYSTCFERK